MNESRHSRRSFLAKVGAGAAMVPLLEVGRARAATPSTFPKRLVFVVTSNGVVQDQFWPTGGERDFAFPSDSPEKPSITAPLAPHRDDVVFLKGVDMKSAKDDKAVHGGHDNFVHLLVGGAKAHLGPRGDHDLGVAATGAGDLSVDQYIVKTTMPPTKFSSLALGVMVQWGALHQSRISWLGDNRPVTPIEDPYKLFDRLHGGAAAGSEALERSRRQRRSILDAVVRDLDGYGKRLGREDRQKLGAHVDAVRAIERQLDPKFQSNGRCVVPTLDGARIDAQKMPNYPAVGRLQTDMAVSALACDLSRVVTLQWSNACNNNVVFSWLGEEFVGKGDEFGNREHHDITHVARRTPDHTRRKCLAERWYMEQFAYLLERMKAVKEGDGTLLDNSIVVFVNNMHDGGAHSHGPHLPFVMAGKGGGFLKTGRFVDLGEKPVAHQRVLASLCEYMGADPAGFGQKAYNSGPLAGLRG